MKAALPKVIAECRDFMRPLSEAHDGFLSEVKEGHEEEYGRIFKKSIEVGIDFRTCSLPRDFELVIPCEVAISKTNWQEMKEVKL
jgi:hypothetical protein